MLETLAFNQMVNTWKIAKYDNALQSILISIIPGIPSVAEDKCIIQVKLLKYYFALCIKTLQLKEHKYVLVSYRK